MIYILNILSAIKRSRQNNSKTLYLTRIEFTKENSNYSIKYQKKQDLILLTTKLSKYLSQDFHSKVLNLVKQK